MLVLSRHKDERIIVHGPSVNITIKIVEIRGDKVRLGITAPKDVKVDREEVFLRECGEILDRSLRTGTQ